VTPFVKSRLLELRQQLFQRSQGTYICGIASCELFDERQVLIDHIYIAFYANSRDVTKLSKFSFTIQFTTKSQYSLRAFASLEFAPKSSILSFSSC
jgi:hypothetical protein